MKRKTQLTPNELSEKIRLPVFISKKEQKAREAPSPRERKSSMKDLHVNSQEAKGRF